MNPIELKLCVECRHYKAGVVEAADMCLHPSSQYGAVREIKLHTCGPMRAGICGTEARHFEAKMAEAA